MILRLLILMCSLDMYCNLNLTLLSMFCELLVWSINIILLFTDGQILMVFLVCLWQAETLLGYLRLREPRQEASTSSP